MARKKVINSENEGETIVVDTPVNNPVEVPEDSAPATKAVEYIEETKQDDNVSIEKKSIKIVDELALAQAQIEHCEDYLNVQGADYKGYMRGKIKEWRKYKYKLRQYDCGNITDIPDRPEFVKDY